MEKIMYWFVNTISKFHNMILGLNDRYERNFTDKELHFLVIGVIGMLLVFAIYPLFKFLAKHHHEMIITWIYVFTLMIVLTFAIEIGQGFSGTGTMEFADIMFGLVGFLFMFIIFCAIRGLVHLILWLVKGDRIDPQ